MSVNCGSVNPKPRFATVVLRYSYYALRKLQPAVRQNFLSQQDSQPIITQLRVPASRPEPLGDRAILARHLRGLNVLRKTPGTDSLLMTKRARQRA